MLVNEFVMYFSTGYMCIFKFSSAPVHYICVKMIVTFISVSMIFYTTETCQVAKGIAPS